MHNHHNCSYRTAMFGGSPNYLFSGSVEKLVEKLAWDWHICAKSELWDPPCASCLVGWIGYI